MLRAARSDPALVHRRAATAAREAARSARAARRARLPHRRSRLDPRDDAAVDQGRAPTRTRNARLVHPRTRAGAAARLADRTGPSHHLQRRRRSRRHGAPPVSAELRRPCDHATATVRAHRTRSDRRVPRRPRRRPRRPATATPDPRQRPAGLRLLPALAAPGHDGAHPERQQGRRDHLLRRPRAARPLRPARTHLGRPLRTARRSSPLDDARPDGCGFNRVTVDSTTSGGDWVTTSATGTAPGRTVGPTTEFSLLFRIQPGHADALRQALDELQNHPGYRPGDYDIPIVSIHEARFVMFDDDTRLAFFTSFDGSWDAYMDDFFNTGATLALFDATFRHTEGYDGLPDMAALHAFVHGAEKTAAAYARNYPGTVKEIRKALRVNDAFQRVLDDPSAAEALQHPALKPLLDEAAE